MSFFQIFLKIFPLVTPQSSGEMLQNSGEMFKNPNV
jgi:hypothetical protein